MEASWTCTNIEMSYRDSKGGRLTLLTEERGFGKADFLYSMSGLCATTTSRRDCHPVVESPEEKSSSTVVKPDCEPLFALTIVTRCVLRISELQHVLSEQLYEENENHLIK